MNADDIRPMVLDTAEEFAKALGYTRYLPGPQIGFINSIGGYYHPTYQHPKPAHPKAIRGNIAFKKMILFPRGVTIFDPDFKIDIETDSTYEQWIVYSTGRIADVEKQFMPLLRQKDEPWTKIKQAWDNDLERRKASLIRRWTELPNTPSSIALPDQSLAPNDISTPTSSKKTPQFGDLKLLAKPTSTSRGRRK